MGRWLLIAAGLALIAVAGLAVYRAFGTPDFVARLVAIAASAAASAVLPDFVRALRPRPFTDDQLARIRRGEDPFRRRPKER
jgi:Na+(H+)/acetate symporter ActP